MKRLISLFALVACAVSVMAQTPEEIINRMEEALKTHEKEGIAMTVDVKIPIVGTMTTKTFVLGEKARMDARMMGKDLITWTDGNTEWTYDKDKNEVEIKKDGDETATSASESSSSAESGDTSLFSDVSEGYDVVIASETPAAWHLQCKKSKDNKEKDAPKTINLVVAKGTYYPVSLSTKMSGVTMTLRDISFGVTEKQVTFDANDYPGVTIVDKR